MDTMAVSHGPVTSARSPRRRGRHRGVALLFAGCGAIVANKQYDGALGAVGVSLVFGLVIVVMVYAIGHVPRPGIDRLYPGWFDFAGSLYSKDPSSSRASTPTSSSASSSR